MGCKYIIKDATGADIVFEDKNALLKHVRDNKLLDTFTANVNKGDPKMDTDTLVKMMRQANFGEIHFSPKQIRDYQELLLDKFIELEEQSTFFYKLGPIIALTKGLGKSYDSIDTVKRNLKELGMDQKKLPEDVPFDARYLISGNPSYKSDNSSPYFHQITANNIKIMNEVDALSRTMFMERTPSYLNIVNKITANLKENVGLSQERTKEIKDELSAFSQIAAYKQWITLTKRKTDTLRNSLVYDTDSKADTIVDIVKKAVKITSEDGTPNAFLEYIMPVSTTIKTAKKNARNLNNKDLINTIEGRTRGKIEPDLVASLMDSFTELYLNPKTNYHAKALFDYLIVKDGLMFKNRSFIKMLPTLMFDHMSQATEMATRTMAANTLDEFRRLVKEFNDMVIKDPVTGDDVSFFTEQDKQRYSFKNMFAAQDITGVKNALYEKVFGLRYNELYNAYEKIYATDIRFQYYLQIVHTTIKRNGVSVNPDGMTITNNKDDLFINVDMWSDAFRAVEKEFPKGSEERKAAFKRTLEELADANIGTRTNEDDNTELVFKKFIRVKAEGGGYLTAQLQRVVRDKKTYTGGDMTAEGQLVPSGTSATYKIVEVVGTSNTTGVANIGPRPSKADLDVHINRKLQEQLQVVVDQAKKGVEASKPTTQATATQGALFNQDVAPKDHAMSYKMPASENLTGRDTTTLELAEQGIRTATTRSFALGKVGDVITFEGRPQRYRITAVEQLTDAKVKSKEWVENWSQKEQWTVDHFNKVLGGSTVHIGSWQTSFQRIDVAPVAQPSTPKTSGPSIFGNISTFQPGDEQGLGNFTDEQVSEEPDDCAK